MENIRNTAPVLYSHNLSIYFGIEFNTAQHRRPLNPPRKQRDFYSDGPSSTHHTVSPEHLALQPFPVSCSLQAGRGGERFAHLLAGDDHGVVDHGAVAQVGGVAQRVGPVGTEGPQAGRLVGCQSNASAAHRMLQRCHDRSSGRMRKACY